jgi:hypothetical protein
MKVSNPRSVESNRKAGLTSDGAALTLAAFMSEQEFNNQQQT